jgi:hypothetical protein
MPIQEGKIVHTSFPPWWDDVVRDKPMLVQDRKLVHAIFPPWWDDFI